MTPRPNRCALPAWADPTSRRWRWWRAGAFSVLAAQISLAGHLLGGGDSPDFAVLLTLSTLLCAMMSGLARHRSRYLVLLAAMGVTQALFHVAATLNVHVHDGAHPWRMLIFHALAAAISAAALRYGDGVLFSVASFLRRILPSVLRSAVIAGRSGAARPADVSAPLSTQRWWSAASGRAPPRLPATS